MPQINKKLNRIAENYKIAWEIVFENKAKWRRDEINRMVKKGDINNKHYLEFIQEVIEEAERGD